MIAVDISPAVEPMTVAPFGPGLSGTRHRRTALGAEHVDLLLHPPIPAIGVLDFKAGAAQALAASGLASRFR